MKTKRSYWMFFIGILLIAALACNLPSAAPVQLPGVQQAPPVGAQPNTGGNPVPVAAGSATPPPLIATIMASTHAATPANMGALGPLNYDVDASGTGPENRAPYGDSYNINLFEREFTQTVMNYLPQLDIVTFQLTQDTTWYYVTMNLVGGDVNDPMNINYGIELDTDHDGFGDYLIWAYPPYTTSWLAETVQVYQDTNHDTGGASAEKSDANATAVAPYPGNGYDKLIFDRGQGNDPDLAWVRLNPQDAASIQFAFKRSLAGNAFMWGVWADAGLRDPSKFNYNDRFTEEQAGSPEKREKYYPIKAIYQVDNTCWMPLGFKPNGYEPHLCPPAEPKPTRQPKPVPTFYILINICLLHPEWCVPPVP
jgi:hypothetical protein